MARVKTACEEEMMSTMRNIELLEAHALHDLDDENEMKAVINDVCAAARRVVATDAEVRRVESILSNDIRNLTEKVIPNIRERAEKAELAALKDTAISGENKAMADLVRSKMRSGNAIAIDRCIITGEEINAALKAVQPQTPGYENVPMGPIGVGYGMPHHEQLGQASVLKLNEEMVSSCLKSFRKELNIRMDTRHPSASPGHDAMRIALRELFERINKG
jgi:hypothetical protein